MNHAEKAEPLPPCRGSIQGKPCKGGENMTEHIHGELLPVEDVLQRWHKDVPFLNELSVTGRIRLLQHEEDRVCPDTGQIVHICTVIPRIPGILGIFPTDGLFVEHFNVGLCETEYQELLWKRQPTTPHKRDIQRKDVELEQARQENAALQAELEQAKEELEKARQAEGEVALSRYGLIAVVDQCRKEGKTPQETAACLKERGASLAIIGALLHPQGDITDWTQYGKNLLNGKTDTLPW